MRRKWSVAALALLPLATWAGHQVCGRTPVASNVRSCPDGSIPVYVADEIKPYSAQTIRPVQPARSVQPMQPIQPGLSHALPSPQPVPANPVADNGRNKPAPAGDPNGLFGVWRTNIPGAVWTSPSGYPGQDWLHVSAGTTAGDLIIKPDGTYVWASYGGKSGRWVKGDAQYPLVLVDTVENRRWKVGVDARHAGQILVWDGNSFYYQGRR